MSINCIAEGKRGGVIEVLATVGSIVLMVLTFPISIFICFKGKFSSHFKTTCITCSVTHEAQNDFLHTFLSSNALSCSRVRESRDIPNGKIEIRWSTR